MLYQPIHGPAWPIDMLKGVLESSINALDKLEITAYASRTIGIPTGSVSTLNFELSTQEKEFPVRLGAQGRGSVLHGQAHRAQQRRRDPVGWRECVTQRLLLGDEGCAC